MGNKSTIFRFDDDSAPNIDLLDKRVVWWNEEYICLGRQKKEVTGTSPLASPEEEVT